jgi:hypothetical protein
MMKKLFTQLFEKLIPQNGNTGYQPVIDDEYWPEKRPVSTLLTNLSILTELGVLPWHHEPYEDYMSAIRVSTHPLDLRNIVGETTVDFFGFTVVIYFTTDNEDQPFFLLFIKSHGDGQLQRIYETEEHRSDKLRALYEAGFCDSNLIPEEDGVDTVVIDKARQRALESVNQMFHLQ